MARRARHPEWMIRDGAVYSVEIRARMARIVVRGFVGRKGVLEWCVNDELPSGNAGSKYNQNHEKHNCSCPIPLMQIHGTQLIAKRFSDGHQMLDC